VAVVSNEYVPLSLPELPPKHHSGLQPPPKFENQYLPGRPPTPAQRSRNSIPFPPFVNIFIIAILVIGFDTGLRMIFRWTKLEQEKTLLEKENVQNQLAFLRTQISPHFFMNTLNNIHAQIDIDTEEAKESIIKLSKLMRHLLYESQDEKTLLKKELEFIKSYVNLMKLRFSDKVKIKLLVPDQIPEKEIPPLLFTSVIENAFKHGISYSSASYINIRIDILEDELQVEIANSKTAQKNEKDNNGIGLENTRKRLELLYPAKYTFRVIDNDEDFTVLISVPL
jgi:LytS/YehU family sensor histidine kinase